MTSFTISPATSVVQVSNVVVSVAVAARIVARKVQKIPLGRDDYSIFLGALFANGSSLVYVFFNKSEDSSYSRDLKALYVSYQLYGVAITTIKLSVLWFYERFSSAPRSPYWHYGFGVLVVIWLLVNNLTAAFQCHPPERYFQLIDMSDLEESDDCIDTLTFFLTMQLLNIVLDVLILIILLSAVLRLGMSKLKMLGLLEIFLVGTLCIVILTKQISIYNSNAHLDSSGAANWRIIEFSVEVICACVPTVVPFGNIDKREKKKSNLEDVEGHTEVLQTNVNGEPELHANPRMDAELPPDDVRGELNDTELHQMPD